MVEIATLEPWCTSLRSPFLDFNPLYLDRKVSSFVQIFTYSYYLLALLKWPCPWKRYITELHMSQFVLCSVHACYVLYEGNVLRSTMRIPIPSPGPMPTPYPEPGCSSVGILRWSNSVSCLRCWASLPIFTMRRIRIHPISPQGSTH